VLAIGTASRRSAAMSPLGLRTRQVDHSCTASVGHPFTGERSPCGTAPESLSAATGLLESIASIRFRRQTIRRSDGRRKIANQGHGPSAQAVWLTQSGSHNRDRMGGLMVQSDHRQICRRRHERRACRPSPPAQQERNGTDGDRLPTRRRPMGWGKSVLQSSDGADLPQAQPHSFTSR
jgi:hypothetical protein